jgi:hypothetical protein
MQIQLTLRNFYSFPIPVQRGLRCMFIAASLLRLRVRVPPRLGCLSLSLSLVSVVCCQVEISASGWLLVQRSLPSVVFLNVFGKPPLWEWPGPVEAVAPLRKKNSHITIHNGFETVDSNSSIPVTTQSYTHTHTWFSSLTMARTLTSHNIDLFFWT